MAKTTSETILADLLRQYVSGTLANKTINKPAQPNTPQYAPYLQVVTKTDRIVPDQVLTGHAVIKQALVDRLHLAPDDVEKIIKRVLPNGIAELRLSTECKQNEALMCEPAPIGKVRYSIAPSKERI